MPAEKEIKDKREPGLCVIRDDDQDWGGPGPEHNEIPADKKIKNKAPIDEPMNWPWGKYRS